MAIVNTSLSSQVIITGLVINTTYQFAISAQNIFGESVLSSSISVLTVTAPSQMSPPTISQSGQNVIITWTSPTNNGADITSFKILLWNGLTYSENTALCNGLLQLVSLSCTIPMTGFSSTLSLPAGTLILARATATNSAGESIQSDISSSTVLVQIKPTSAPTGISYLHNVTSATLQWSQLTGSQNIGFSQISSYSINWDNGTAEAMNQVLSTSSLSGTITLPTPGITYNFEIAAVNIMGTGPYSSVIAIEASSTPNQIATLVVSQTNLNSSVFFTWNTPTDNYSPITSYNVYILQKSTGLFKVFSWICSGSQGVDGSGNQYCIVNMPTFIQDLGYQLGQLIQFKATAVNLNGESSLSAVSTGTVYAQSIPTLAVSNLAYTLANSTDLTLTWDLLTTDLAQGYSQITGYQIQMDSGSGF